MRKVGKGKRWSNYICIQIFDKTLKAEHEVTKKCVEVWGIIEGEGVGVDMIKLYYIYIYNFQKINYFLF